MNSSSSVTDDDALADQPRPRKNSMELNRQGNAVNLMRYMVVKCNWTRLAVARRALHAARVGDMGMLIKSIGNYKRMFFLNNGESPFLRSVHLPPSLPDIDPRTHHPFGDLALRRAAPTQPVH